MEKIGPLKVLVLTNDGDHTKVAQSSLASFGIQEIVVMNDGLQALDKLRTISFDFLICDQNIRFVSGWQLIKEIRLSESIPNIPVLLFGKTESPDTEANLQKYGIVKYLKSPFNPSSLNFLINSTITLAGTSGTIENKYTRAKASLIAQNPKEAIALFSELRWQTENSTRSMIGLAISHAKNGDPGSAEDLLEQVAKRAEDTPACMLVAARIHLRNGKLADGSNLLQKLLSEMPSEFNYSRVARLYLDYHLFKDAQGLCLEAIGKDFLSIDIYICLAKCYYANGVMDKSLSSITDVETMFGLNSELYNLRGVCLKKLGLFEEAVYAYEEALKLNPNDAKIYFNMAMCAIGTKDYPMAHRHLATCLKIAPEFPKAVEKFAEIDAKIGQTMPPEGVKATG